MMLRTAKTRRPGSILPMLAICSVALFGFVALAIDIGMIVVARTECQAAADCAAMAGARTLNGDVTNNNNYAAVRPNVETVATACKVLSQSIQKEWVSSEIGYYTYDRPNAKFGKLLPSSGSTMPTGENWSLVTVTVSYGQTSYFAKVFGVNSFQSSAVATAVHRPRDVAIIIDFSGSMSFDSLLGASYTGSRTQSVNPETVYPQFGHYSSASFNPAASAGYVLGSGEVLGLSNLTVDTSAGPAMVNDYYQNAFGGTPTPAFTAAPDSYATAPAGDTPLRRNFNASGQPYAANVTEVLNGTAVYNAGWETSGYNWASLTSPKPFTGYTTGPRYWGKTFFAWPPDPTLDAGGKPNDWRKKFFLKGDKATPVDDNSILWTTGSGATVKVPIATGSTMTSYYINYAAILRWLTTSGPNPFPSQLRAGRIYYYTAIPDISNPSNDAALNNRMYSANPADLNERFWKHYIDHVLGFQQSGTTYTNIEARVGYGAGFTYGTKTISAKPTVSLPNDSPTPRYMNYADNPPRPKTGYWFGPMTMLDFIDNYNQSRRWMPGTAHQAPSWGCKVGMRAGMLDIKNNHPNDYVCLSFFNSPSYASGDNGKYNRIRAPLGHDYSRMVDLLFYPMITVDSPSLFPEINCYDTTHMLEAPRADGSTCPAMSFMQTYNQFATSSALASYNTNPGAPVGDAGGLGRKGAQKVIIFETDGVANTPANATFVNSGPYTSYYRIRVGASIEYPTNSNGSFSGVDTQLYDIAQHICNQDNAATPGYSTPKKPVLIHSIAYGSLFDPSVSAGASAARTSALAILQQLQYIGKTQNSPSDALPSYKIITGTSQERVDRIQQAFQHIMDSTVAVTLIE